MIRLLLRDFERVVCAVLLLAMTALGFVNVVVRYATDLSFAASEELLTNGFLLLTIFGAAIAARRGEHLAVTLVHDLLPPRARRPLLVLAVALSALLLALSAWFSWELVVNQRASGIRSYGLQIPSWTYSAAMPLGFALIGLRYLQHAVAELRTPPDA